ncbi:uncharacterized protein LOC143187593 [Calliopsis andreniformis]|uniref:uncharacterized protein LOC143187593 n=1 Tax=Calliopsis andreniformis TaxID=337506 RepID=UPI003FCDA780
MISKPNFQSRCIFSENLIAIELRKLMVKFNKSIYVCMAILNIFHYDYMCPLHQRNCKIMYTDTDRLIYYIQCEDVYEMMKRDMHRFDTSDYPTDNVYGIPLINKKVPGSMKNENSGSIMTEFIGLRAKVYALKEFGKKDVKTLKSVKNNVVAKMINFDDYKHCLRNAFEITRRQSCIRSKLHKVYIVTELKIALSPYDDKRYLISDSNDTLPWGHYKIKL